MLRRISGAPSRGTWNSIGGRLLELSYLTDQYHVLSKFPIIVSSDFGGLMGALKQPVCPSHSRLHQSFVRIEKFNSGTAVPSVSQIL
jgi:hypothetical protein